MGKSMCKNLSSSSSSEWPIHFLSISQMPSTGEGHRGSKAGLLYLPECVHGGAKEPYIFMSTVFSIALPPLKCFGFTLLI
jgi:hypothetical protein